MLWSSGGWPGPPWLAKVTHDPREAMATAELARRAEAYFKSRGFDVQGYDFALTFEQTFWGIC